MQQAVSKGPSENSRRVGSLCNSGTNVFEKTLFILFLRIVFSKWMQLRNRQFPNDPMNIQVEVLEFEADATAEQVFLKRPPNFFWGKESSKF